MGRCRLGRHQLRYSRGSLRAVLSVIVLYTSAVRPLLVNAQWTRLWEYIPSKSRNVSEQAQPLKRAAHSMVVFENSLYVFGGIGDTSGAEDYEYDDTWRFDLVNRNWTNIIGDRVGTTQGPVVSPPHRFHHSTALHTNGTVQEMVMFGGLSVTQTLKIDSSGVDIKITQFNDVWRLSLNPLGSETWKLDAASTTSISSSLNGSSNSTSGSASSPVIAPAPRSEAGAVVHDGQLYVFGGISYDEGKDTTPMNYGDLWRYSLSDCTWTKIMARDGISPPARFSHSLTKFTNDRGETFLLVFSGRHLELPTWNLLGDSWVFSLSTQTWSPVSSTLPLQRAYTSVVTTDGENPRIWFYGGYFRPKQGTSGYVYDDVVSGLLTRNSDNSTSSQFYHAVFGGDDAVPPLRYNHRAVLWKDSMIVHGGSYQSQRGDLWLFNLTTAVLRKDSAMAMPVNMETLVYVLMGFVFSIVIVLIGLIIRWRQVDRRNLEIARMRGVAVMRGVAKERLDRMVITKYKKPAKDDAPMPAESVDDAGQNNEDICPICLIEFEEDEDVRNLPCKHLFHVACIDEWLGRNTTCPMCKNNLDLEVVDVEIGSDVGTASGANSLSPNLTVMPLQVTTSSTPAIPEPRGGAIVTPVTTGQP